jgi:hypothetical protein
MALATILVSELTAGQEKARIYYDDIAVTEGLYGER